MDIIYLLFNYRSVGEFAFIVLSLKTLFGRRIHLHHAAMALTIFKLFIHYVPKKKKENTNYVLKKL